MVCKLEKEISSGLESTENAPKSGGLKSASCDETVLIVKETVERDARYTVRDMARMVDISLSRVHYKNIINARKTSARWVPHLLTDGQKTIAQNISKI